jgi:hypothetical protein
MRKGFSIFSPMVGTIVILIAMFVMTSIIVNEQSELAGVIQNYKDTEVTEVARLVQSRLTDKTRQSLTNDLEASLNIPLYIWCSRENLDGGKGRDDRTKCIEYSRHQFENQMKATVSGAKMIKDAVDDIILAIPQDSRIKIEPTAPDVEVAVTELSFVGSSGKNRYLVDSKSEWGLVQDVPIARIRTEEGDQLMLVYMRSGSDEYKMKEPMGLYLEAIVMAFGPPEILDDDMHGKGGRMREGENWYEYKYAYHVRKAMATNSMGVSPASADDDISGVVQQTPDLGACTTAYFGSVNEILGESAITTDYDEAKEESLKETAEWLYDEFENPGYDFIDRLDYADTTPEFTIEVESRQYYARIEGYRDYYDWQCGQYKCDGITHKFVCDTYVLYKVQEGIKLYRNTPQGGREKKLIMNYVNVVLEDPEDVRDSNAVVKLENPGTGVSADAVKSDQYSRGGNDESDWERKCTYTVTIGRGIVGSTDYTGDCDDSRLSF